MNAKHLILSTLLVTPILSAQIPPSVDPSQVVSGITASGQYNYQLKDGSEAHGVIMNNVDPKTGSGVIFTIPARGLSWPVLELLTLVIMVIIGMTASTYVSAQRLVKLKVVESLRDL